MAVFYAKRRHKPGRRPANLGGLTSKSAPLARACPRTPVMLLIVSDLLRPFLLPYMLFVLLPYLRHPLQRISEEHHSKAC